MGDLNTTALVYDELFKVMNYKNGGLLSKEELEAYFVDFMGTCRKGHENNSYNATPDYKGEECYQVKDEVPKAADIKPEVKVEAKTE